MKSDLASHQVLFMALATQRFPDLARMILKELYHKGVDTGVAHRTSLSQEKWDQMRKKLVEDGNPNWTSYSKNTKRC